MKSHTPTPGVALGRALRRRCPRCGHRPIFRRWFTMASDCDGCGYHFEREDGFFLGAYTINFALTELAILAVLAVMVLRPGHGSVRPILAWALAAAVLVPALCYPYSKAIWCAIDLTMRRSMGESFGGDGTQPGHSRSASNLGAGRRLDGSRVSTPAGARGPTAPPDERSGDG